MAEVLNLVAIREQEHAAAFTKRICELGYHVRQKSNDRFFEQLENPPADDNLLRDIVNRLDRLTSTLEELKTLRR